MYTEETIISLGHSKRFWLSKGKSIGFFVLWWLAFIRRKKLYCVLRFALWFYSQVRRNKSPIVRKIIIVEWFALFVLLKWKTKSSDVFADHKSLAVKLFWAIFFIPSLSVNLMLSMLFITTFTSVCKCYSRFCALTKNDLEEGLDSVVCMLNILYIYV